MKSLILDRWHGRFCQYERMVISAIEDEDAGRHDIAAKKIACARDGFAIEFEAAKAMIDTCEAEGYELKAVWYCCMNAHRRAVEDFETYKAKLYARVATKEE